MKTIEELKEELLETVTETELQEMWITFDKIANDFEDNTSRNNTILVGLKTRINYLKDIVFRLKETAKSIITLDQEHSILNDKKMTVTLAKNLLDAKLFEFNIKEYNLDRLNSTYNAHEKAIRNSIFDKKNEISLSPNIT